MKAEASGLLPQCHSCFPHRRALLLKHLNMQIYLCIDGSWTSIQRFMLLARVGVDSEWEQKKLEIRKIPHAAKRQLSAHALWAGFAKLF